MQQVYQSAVTGVVRGGVGGWLPSHRARGRGRFATAILSPDVAPGAGAGVTTDETASSFHGPLTDRNRPTRRHTTGQAQEVRKTRW